MTKSRQYALLASVLAILVGIPVTAHAHDPEVAAIVALAGRSQRMGRACASYLDSLGAATQDSAKTEYYVSRASALVVLDRGGSYPGTPIATSEAIDRFLAVGTMPGGASAQELRIAVLALSDCHAAEYYGFLVRLVNPRSQALLTAAERLRVRNLVLAYIRREASGNAKPAIQTELITQLLNRSVREGLVSISREGRADLATLAWRVRQFSRENAPTLAKREALGSKLSGVPSDLKADSRFLVELAEKYEEAEDLRYDLQDLIDSESERGFLLPQGQPAPKRPLAELRLGINTPQLNDGTDASMSGHRVPRRSPAIPESRMKSILPSGTGFAHLF